MVFPVYVQIDVWVTALNEIYTEISEHLCLEFYYTAWNKTSQLISPAQFFSGVKNSHGSSAFINNAFIKFIIYNL